ncbi:MAG: toprim domain-containing protein [Pseudomonadota bacterium]
MNHNSITAGVMQHWPDSKPPHEFHAGRYTRISDGSASGDKPIWVYPFNDGSAVAGNWKTGEKEFIAGPNGPRARPSPAFLMREAQRRMRDEKEREPEWERAAERNQKLFDEGELVSLRNTAGKYLNNRHVFVLGGNLGLVLRHHGAVPYYHDGELVGCFPALLGAITDAAGNMRAVHRTYLHPLGGKAHVPSPKKITHTSGPLQGCSIKLFKVRPIEGVLTIGVAEGIETALAGFVLNNLPTVATISAMGMQRFVFPDGLGRLMVYGDNDKSGVGQGAARHLATRAHQAGIDVRVFIPPETGADWADVLLDRMEADE